VKQLRDYDLAAIARHIDWSPFFHTWELRGRYPAIFQDKKQGPTARKLFDDAQALLKKIIAGKLLTARGVIGLFPAQSVGDDVEIYAGEDRQSPLAVFHTLRQQIYKDPIKLLSFRLWLYCFDRCFVLLLSRSKDCWLDRKICVPIPLL